MLKKVFTATVGLYLMATNCVNAQQDAQFSQYMFNGIYINPAYAGYREVLNVHAFYRSQWTGIAHAPKSLSCAVDAVANHSNVGLALQIASDKIGAQRNMSVYGNYAYRIRMNDQGTSRLALGLGLGFVQFAIDGSLLNANELEINQPVGVERTIVPDGRAGIYFSNDQFYAGISADNLIAQYINIQRYALAPQPKMHYYLTAGMLFPLFDDYQIKPSFLLKDDVGGPTSLDISAFFMIKHILWLGGSYRTAVKLYDKGYLQKDLSKTNSAIACVQIFPGEKLRIGYAYDFSIGPLRGYSGGTHEISVSFSFEKLNNRINNPKIF